MENHIFLRDKQSNYLQVFQNFINERKKTNRMRFFSCRPFPNIFKYKDHRWQLPTISIKRLFQKIIVEFSLYVGLIYLPIWGLQSLKTVNSSDGYYFYNGPL